MRLLPVYSRDGVVGWTRVDDADYDFLSQFRWNRCGTAPRWYVHGRVCGERITMHRLLLGLKAGDKRQADHIDRDRFNNQRANLRICTVGQNHRNTVARKGRYRGVSWSHDHQKWRATVLLNGRQHFGGYFDDEAGAGRAARDLRARLYTHSMN